MKAEDYLRRRRDAGLTTAEVARRTGYDRSHVSRVETDQRGSSVDYESAFRMAVSPNYTESASLGDTRVLAPTLRARKAVGESNRDLRKAIGGLEDLRNVLSAILRSAKAISVQADTLADGTMEGVNTDRFDPLHASDDDMEIVTSYICGVMLEMVTEHKFHTLPGDSVDEYLQAWTARVAKEAKKYRNRERSVPVGNTSGWRS